jgi:hypothetical protein
LGYFFHAKSCVLITKKNVFGYILGDFFTNSSGHPDRHRSGTKSHWKRLLPVRAQTIAIFRHLSDCQLWAILFEKNTGM